MKVPGDSTIRRLGLLWGGWSQRGSPSRRSILVPYLVLFFASILLMGAPMFRLDRRLWLVTVVTTVLLLGSMGIAMGTGVG